MPQIIQARTWKVKVGLADFFKTEINFIKREFKPRTDDLEDWQAFERAYEEALHFLRLNVVKTLNRDEKMIYGFRKVNPRMQKAQAAQKEELFAKQDIQRRLLKPKSKLEQLEKYEEESSAAQRKRVKIVTELDRFLKFISPEARGEIFGEKSMKRSGRN
jgi:hypothetical protein